MGKKYFGTDGIRGEANRELTVDIALRLGYALGHYLRKGKNPDEKIRVVMGCDTRISGYMLRSALTAGLNSMGVYVNFVGVIPTPAVAYITKEKNADAGIMISASHNPAKDNGLKLFNSNGYKFSDEIEDEIENYMDNIEDIITNPRAGDKVGKFKYAEDEYFLYRDHLIKTVKGDFKGIKIVLDTANGSAYRAAKDVFLELGAELVVINDVPNGRNINVKCGSTHPEILSKVVVGYEADLGLAYDGDADRLIAVDKFGNVIDGDKVIAILALELKRKGLLKNNKVVTTVMSNMGFEKFLNDNGIELLRANVGDRYVLEKMLREDVAIGGEQSGHIILSEYATTGDGILSSLKLVEAIRDLGKNLDTLVAEIKDWPQFLINVKVDNKKKDTWNQNKNITDFISEIERKYIGEIRVLVRKSGTEPLIRVMTEGQEKILVEKIAKDIANLIEKELG
ncbi:MULTISPECIES: phosphoglucosamine mutase [Fusobacterium]|uniref:phosphoglucosamine mutase n=1 Tax=Fusobacterium TaxID=848 RepID=UPI0025C26759|nr:phosphoglucosamine mutase [Fusobacterium sp.]MCI5725625.1 phosphoglucosamine mutase [Fusobacterium sp.]MDD7409826.1 phosphoglucosamine mutase [Fusobacteriaceae bacterium]MDY5712948.1 phosphoglucosamine mutase [Fusobacterium gastrosuis]